MRPTGKESIYIGLARPDPWGKRSKLQSCFGSTVFLPLQDDDGLKIQKEATPQLAFFFFFAKGECYHPFSLKKGECYGHLRFFLDSVLIFLK